MPDGADMECALRFNFEVSNNEAKYEALVVGLGLASSLGTEQLSAYTDSQPVVNQVLEVYEARREKRPCRRIWQK